jgi:glycerol-3-phosphate acyltransferase PlsY
LCLLVLFFLIAVAFRYVSLGSIAVAAAFPLLAWALHEYVDPTQLVFIALVSALVIWKHRQNIGRIATGTESKFGSKSETKSEEESGTKLDGKSGTLGATRR